MVREGNLYAVPYADHILNMASESSGYRLADEDVPFLQMVFHGRKTMAGTPINLKSDYRRQVLRAIEYGMSLHVQLTGRIPRFSRIPTARITIPPAIGSGWISSRRIRSWWRKCSARSRVQ